MTVPSKSRTNSERVKKTTRANLFFVRQINTGNTTKTIDLHGYVDNSAAII